jgi:predicted GH43/DUF377 family glycosyl hydrolase
MKRFILSLAIFISLLLYSCTSETPVSPDVQKGGITLNIDRAHKPANVVEVTAYLTREGFDTISGTLNLLSDTTADMTFNDIAAGQWHLKVDAADEDSTVVYTGETDVNILAGITTQVYLTLVPTGGGTGSIHIIVNWGVPQNTDWIDYQYNPIASPPMVPVTPLGLIRPKVYLEDGIYKMWFTSVYNSARMDIWYAVSNDGINWQLGSNSPVLTHGGINSWDSYTVVTGPVLKDSTGYKMYYLGFQDENGYWHIGLATSPDGINWTKYPDPVLYAGWDEIRLLPDDIIVIDNVYYLYYSIKQYPYYDIRLATSTDGINFIKSNNNPLLVADANWEGEGIYSPSVIYENNEYKMIYANVNLPEGALGMAYSNDGINWTKDSHNPFFTNADIPSNWCDRITYPFWRKYNDQYRIYYNGNTSGYYVAEIGMIYK